jgi:uncharacterized Zn-finger protein
MFKVMPNLQLNANFVKKSFKFRTNLRAHINTEHLNADKRFVCGICGKDLKQNFRKSLKSNTRLKTHSVVHSDRQDFKCEICEKRFKRNGDLKEHLRRHENK